MMFNKHSTSRMLSLALLAMSCGSGQGLAIAKHQLPFIQRQNRSWNTATSRQIIRNRSSTKLDMYVDELLPIASMKIPLLSQILISPSTASLVSTPSNIFSATSQLITSDPQFEAEVLSDASHVALDFTTFFIPCTTWLRLFNVIGRIMLLSSDYVQDNHINPDECFFQVFMLVVSSNLFLRSIWPLMSTAFSSRTLTFRDRRAYALLFDDVGLSVLQFRTLLASRTLDWIELAPHQEIELNGDNMYWLYDGSVAGSNDKVEVKIDESLETSADEVGIGSRIFGEVHFAKALEASMYSSKSKSAKKETSSEKQEESSTIMNGKLVAGPEGATLLRMSSPKLLEFMSDDDQLSGSIQMLVLMCMQDKLSRTFHQGNPVPSPPSTTKSNVYHPSYSCPSASNATCDCPCHEVL